VYSLFKLISVSALLACIYATRHSKIVHKYTTHLSTIAFDDQNGFPYNIITNFFLGVK